MTKYYNDSIKYEVIDWYGKGSSIKSIKEELGLDKEEVISILLDFKEESKMKNSFTDEFKMMIADRDLGGVKRNSIAKELQLNIHTVRKACEKFGEQFKEFPSPNSVSTIITGIDSLEVCPSCKSKEVNEIDSIIENINTVGVFCMDCGDEHFMLDGKVHKVNWEYIN